MGRVCAICGKTPMHGNKVSKSFHHTKRVWRPNLVKVKTGDFGKVSTIKICTRCLRSGFIEKIVRVPKEKAKVAE